MRPFSSGHDDPRRDAPEAPVSVPSECPACRSSAISTTNRQPDANSYWRCGGCGEIWNAGRRETVRRETNPWR